MEVITKDDEQYLKIELMKGETLISEHDLKYLLNRGIERKNSLEVETKIFDSMIKTMSDLHEEELKSMHGNKYILVNRVDVACAMPKFDTDDPRMRLCSKVFQRAWKVEKKHNKPCRYFPISVSEYKKIFSDFEIKPKWIKRK